VGVWGVVRVRVCVEVSHYWDGGQ